MCGLGPASRVKQILTFPVKRTCHFTVCPRQKRSLYLALVRSCPDARERAGPVFPPPPQGLSRLKKREQDARARESSAQPQGEEETQAQRARARRDKVRSIFEHLSVIWSPCSPNSVARLEKIQRRGVKWILGELGFHYNDQ